MESYDVFLMGNFVALPAFTAKYGVWDPATQANVVVPQWQSALQVSGQLGALIGVFIAGPLTSRIGYRYATLTGLMLLNIFIFAFYFASSLPVRLCRSSCGPLQRRCYRCSGPLAVSLSVELHFVTTPLQHRKPTSMRRCRAILFEDVTDERTGFPSRFNGCSRRPWPSSFSVPQKVHGGWSGRDDSNKQHARLSVSDASHK